MGRYFQHAAWPTSDFEGAVAYGAVPQSRLAFHASGGPYLLGLRAQVFNGTAGAAQWSIKLQLDGVDVQPITPFFNIPANTDWHFIDVWLQEIPAGPHVLEVLAAGAAAVGDTLYALTGRIFGIELNPQEVSDRIEGP